jgi:hypothetical protein
VLQIPVRNSTRVDLIQHEPAISGFKLTVSSAAAAAGGVSQQQQQQQVMYARKVVLATGIQVGLHWGRGVRLKCLTFFSVLRYLEAA